MKKIYMLKKGLNAGGAPIMWERIIADVVPYFRNLIKKDSKILEIGYGDGILSCWISTEFDVYITGYEINEKCQCEAIRNAKEFRMGDRINFEVCSPKRILQKSGQYDAVFIKTVLYNSKCLKEYGKWLDWINSILKPGGVFVNFETGRGKYLTQIYRKLRKRPYANLSLYTSDVEKLYDDRFKIITRHYYGGISQFLTPITALYRVAHKIENRFTFRDANNCFIVSIIARRTKKMINE